MHPGRCLIVNADDFGLSPGINRGIIEAHERGIVTSTSLMVRQPGASEAASLIRAHHELSVGLHVDLGEWACAGGDWFAVYEVVPLSDLAAVAKEVERQFALFTELAQREPTHLDSHQHLHRTEPLRSILSQHAVRRGIPLRHCTPQIRYCGGFYGQADRGVPYPEGISVDSLVKLLTSLPSGLTELACHPGYTEALTSSYNREREIELQTLCAPEVRKAVEIAGIRLYTFAREQVGRALTCDVI